MLDDMCLDKPSAKTAAKKDKLIFIIKNLLANSRYSAHLMRIMAKAGLNPERVVNSFLDYNLDLTVRDNEVYTGMENRLVLHAHHLIAGSWHQNKQRCITQAMRALPASSHVIEMGFGVPTQYIRDFALQERSIKVTLCDFDHVAFDFAKILLDDWALNWQEVINFRHEDMNQMRYLGNYDTYVFQDCIEHTLDPTAYLCQQVNNAPSAAKFVFILPIGPLIPMHYIAWETLDVAKTWLKHCKLTINDYTVIKTNPAIDLFASDTPFTFGFFNCSKR